MTRHRFVRIGVILVSSLGVAAPAAAHRLDEYLQATRIAVQRDRIDLEVDLTPGASIADATFALIDADRDGRISSTEGMAYASAVLAAMRLTVDGRAIPVAIEGRDFPEREALALGIGTIKLRATALVPSGIGRHELGYVNGHAPTFTPGPNDTARPTPSVYLVNALMPSDQRVRIGAQHRDVAQQGLTLDYEVSPDSKWVRGGWLLTAVAMFGVLCKRRGWSG